MLQDVAGCITDDLRTYDQRASGARMTVGLAAQRAGDLLEGLVDRADREMIDARQ
jgi:hypothetical protein